MDDLHRLKVRELWLQDISGTYPLDGTVLYARGDGLVKTNAGIYVPEPGDLAVPGTLYATHVVAVDVSATTVDAVYVNAVDVSANEITTNHITLTGPCGSISGVPGEPSYSLTWMKQQPTFNTQFTENLSTIDFGVPILPRNMKNITCDSSGNVYVAYSTRGLISSNTATDRTDVVVAKFTSDGTLSWVVQPDFMNNSSAPTIAYGPNNDLYVACCPGYATRLFRMNPDNGDIIWLDQLVNPDPPNDGIFPSIVISDSNVWRINSEGVTPATSSPSVFKYDANGLIIFGTNLNRFVTVVDTAISSTHIYVLQQEWASPTDFPHTIMPDPINAPIYNLHLDVVDLATGAVTVGSTDALFNPVAPWGTQTLSGLSIVVGPDQNPVFIYFTTSNAPGTTYSGSGVDIVVVKVNGTTLVPLWIRQFSTGWTDPTVLSASTSSIGSSLTVDSEGRILILYTTNVGTDIDLKIKTFNSAGAELSTFAPPFANTLLPDYVPSITTVPGTRDVIIAYHTDGQVQGGTQSGGGDLVVARYVYNSTTITLQPDGGYVGIGTCDPAYTLDVSGTIRSSTGLILSDPAGGVVADVRVLDNLGYQGELQQTPGVTQLRQVNTSTDAIQTPYLSLVQPVATMYVNDIAGNQIVTIPNVGDIGMGRSLDVNGTVSADSLLVEPAASSAIVKMKLSPAPPSTQKLVSMDTTTNQLFTQPITVVTPAVARYVACGKGAPGEPTLQWSDDGLTWYPATSGSFTDRGFNAAYGNGLWIAVGKDASPSAISSIKVSIDGKTWGPITSGGFATGVGYKVAWNGSLWVATGDSPTKLNTIQWSTDGINWINIQTGGFNSASPSSGGYGLTWTGSLWIAAGFDSAALDTIQRSPDGKNWTSSSSGGFVPGGGGIFTTGTLHIAVGGSSAFIQYSTDAANWTAVGSAPQVPADITYNGSRWIAVGGNGDGVTTKTIYTSTLGTSGWTEITSGGFNNAVGAGGRAVIWGGDKWIATGVITGSDTTTTILWSSDGLTWQSITSGGFSQVGEGLAYAPISVSITGNLTVNGTFSATSKAFRIPHPVLPNTTLYHIAIEGPRADLVYRGRATLVDGMATVQIDTESTAKGHGMTIGTFEALAANPQVFVSNNESWERVRGSVTGGILTIECESAKSTATVDWLIVAERKDASMKASEITDADGFLIPEHPPQVIAYP